VAVTYQGRYVSSDDLRDRLNPTTYLAIFDDDNAGEGSANPVQLVIDSAEGEVDSYLITENALPLPALTGGKTDRLVKLCALDFAQALSYERHPEYARTFGEDAKKMSIWKRASERMGRIQAARQQLPDVVEQAGPKPANVGGIVYDSGPRTITNSLDGTDNGGDF
jgi:phage gp36-like protein